MGTDGSADYSLIVIGASAGGVEALVEWARAPRASAAGLFCPVAPSPAPPLPPLPPTPTRAAPLHAKLPNEGHPPNPACIFVAPPNYHLLVARGQLHLTREPR